MKKFILTCAIALAATQAIAQNATITKEQMEQIKKAQEMMNSPEYQQQMKRAAERMKQQGIDPSKMGNMQMMMNPKMIEAGMGMSACIQKNPGEAGMNRISKKAQEMDTQIQALCKLGKKDEANAMQKDLSMKMLADPDMIAMRACAEQYKDVLNDPSMAEFRKNIDELSVEKQKDACG